MTSMDLSIVDLGTVAPGTTETEALQDALATARHAEELGYRRIWFAEHHLSRSGASHHPEVLISAASQQTTRIRLGSGAVLMNHYSPFKVAELYAQLEALAPGRIDLGMGRATAGPVLDLALQQNRENPAKVDHAQQVLETLAWLDSAFPEDHPFHGHQLIPSLTSAPEPWLLGSSPGSARLAAQLGIGYVYAGFINPGQAQVALRGYREDFRPTEFGGDRPRSILAMNVTVGDDDAAATHLVGSAKGYYARLSRAGRQAGSVMVPSAAEAASELSPEQAAEPTDFGPQGSDGAWPRFVSGAPQAVADTLSRMARATEADEIMVQDLIADPEDRRRSHALLADAFGVAQPSA